jgi:hypothetical protein
MVAPRGEMSWRRKGSRNVPDADDSIDYRVVEATTLAPTNRTMLDVRGDCSPSPSPSGLRNYCTQNCTRTHAFSFPPVPRSSSLSEGERYSPSRDAPLIMPGSWVRVPPLLSTSQSLPSGWLELLGGTTSKTALLFRRFCSACRFTKAPVRRVVLQLRHHRSGCGARFPCTRVTNKKGPR